ncbi:MAG: thiamine pyrophosphate-dependent dehydrogenase E1 component subunit alpha [Pirellulaceae bacterium]
MVELELYKAMVKARAFELVLADMWEAGLISGEMHLGTGEEAVAAGVTRHLRSGDAVSLDHRPTPVLTLLGVDLQLMLREMLGREDGLCRGRGGHMHLFSKTHLAASSGIVGSSGPVATGFALSAKLLRPGSVAVACFGEGAMNQGMLMESMNLAVAWKLPLLFLCKDNRWAITTRSADVTAGSLLQRAAGFGLPCQEVDGLDVMAVSEKASKAIGQIRKDSQPYFLLARTSRLDSHQMGDPMRRMAQHPVGEGGKTFGNVTRHLLAPRGSGPVTRIKSLMHLLDLLKDARKDVREHKTDPLFLTRQQLKQDEQDTESIEQDVAREMEFLVDSVQANSPAEGVHGQHEL